MNNAPRRWPLLFASGVGLVILLALGTWQLFRLQEKNALIAAIDQNLAAPPQPFHDGTGLYGFAKVQLVGRYTGAKSLLKLASHNGGPGYFVLSPFMTSDSQFILVNRGTVPEGITPETPQGPQTLVGVLRRHGGGQGFFDPDNDPDAGFWSWWDVPAMLAAAEVPPDAQVTTYILDLLPDKNLPDLPKPLVPKAELRNNHLGYAITWFGLAAALVGVAGAFLRKHKSAKG